MSQDIFNVLAATMDTSGLSVQSLLDAQPPPEGGSPTGDDDDVFQCGKCKKQYTSLTSFMCHKRECTQALTGLANLTTAISRQQSVSATMVPPSANSAFTVTAHQLNRNAVVEQVPQSPLAQLTPGMILNDEVLVSPFTSLEQNMHQGIQQLQNNIQQLQNNLLQPATLTTSPFLTSQPGARLVTSVSNVAVTGGLQNPQVLTTANGTVNIGNNQLIQLSFQPSLTAQPIAHHTTHTEADVTHTSMRRLLAADGSQTLTRLHAIAPAEPTEPSTSPNLSNLSLPKRGRRQADPNRKPGKLRCTYCRHSFNKNFDLQQHLRSHTGEKPFQCIVCGRAFAQKSNVKKHMQTHKVWPGGKQDTLPKQLITKVASEKDKEKEGTTSEQIQQELGNVYLSNDENTYMYIDSSYVCKFCDEKFKTYFQLKSHLTLHKDKQVYKCVVQTCSETFKDMDKFIDHTKTHEKEMTYRCRLCNKHFPTLYELGVHQFSHSLYPNQGPKSAPKDFKCIKCNSRYATPEALEHHLTTTTHSYSCPECQKVFPCERYLRRHLVSHAATGQFMCEICNKHFKTEYYLRTHILIHTGQKPFKCDICNAEFNRKDKVKRHKLIHNASKKYKCPFRTLTGCKREFHRADKLKAHIISHSGIKPFKCELCARCFSRKPTLMEHIKLHTREFDVFCKQCGKGFAREKYLEGHRCGSNKGPKRSGDKSADQKITDEDYDSLDEAAIFKNIKGPSKKKEAKKRQDIDQDQTPRRIVQTKTRKVLMKGPALVKKTRKSKTQYSKQAPETIHKYSYVDEDVNIIRKALTSGEDSFDIVHLHSSDGAVEEDKVLGDEVISSSVASFQDMTAGSTLESILSNE